MPSATLGGAGHLGARVRRPRRSPERSRRDVFGRHEAAPQPGRGDPPPDPDLVLLDEPTVGVDPQSRNAIFDSLLALKREGKTIVYTTHYMEEAERLCNRVAIINRGKLLALDTVHGLTQTHGGPPTLILRTPAGEEHIETRNPLAD